MKKAICLMVLLAFVAAFAACAPKQPAAAEQITVILDYVPNTNHTGLYVARELGYYAEQGLDVEIIQPSEGATATLIAAGKGDFGISYQEDVTYARTAQDPLPIRAIAAVLAHNTSGFASYAPKNITSPKDFEDKTYVGWGSPAEEAIVKAVMERAGADPNKLNIINFGDEDFFAMAKSSVDIAWIFYAWTGIEGETLEFPMNYLPVADLHPALDFYTPVIIASESTINGKPELVKRFLAATAKGYVYAAQNPGEAAAIFSKLVPEYDSGFILRSQEWISPKYIDDAPRWGVMDAARWDAYTDFMSENGLISKPMPAQEAFTNDLLPQ